LADRLHKRSTAEKGLEPLIKDCESEALSLRGERKAPAPLQAAQTSQPAAARPAAAKK